MSIAESPWRSVERAVWQGLESHGFFVGNFGFLPPTALLAIAHQLGSPMETPAGKIIHVTPVADTSYKPLTHDAVPFHNDGTYLSDPPRYLLLFCDRTGQGGETILLQGDAVVKEMDPGLRSVLKSGEFTTSVGDKSATRPLINPHPEYGTPVLFFLDPDLSVECGLTIDGRPLPADMLRALRAELVDSKPALRHCWSENDLLILDNYRVLHARTSFTGLRKLTRILIH